MDLKKSGSACGGVGTHAPSATPARCTTTTLPFLMNFRVEPGWARRRAADPSIRVDVALSCLGIL